MLLKVGSNEWIIADQTARLPAKGCQAGWWKRAFCLMLKK